MMTRRDALLRLTACLGGTIFGAHRFLSGTSFAAETRPSPLLSATDLELLNEVADTILPDTETSPGARAANVAAFMADIARDFYDEAERLLLLSAPAEFNAASRSRHAARDFLALDPSERFQLLLTLDRMAPQPPYYSMVKQLTLWGYWTSEVGTKHALRYVPVPGTYQGCIDVDPTTRAWAGS